MAETHNVNETSDDKTVMINFLVVGIPIILLICLLFFAKSYIS